MRRALGTVIALALAARSAIAACGPIATRVMRTGAERTLAADPIADLPDGLHVALCGAGGPMPSTNRSGPCVAVVAGRTLFVVDAGTNGARNLQGAIGWRPGRIAAVFLTHYHSDHIDGLGEMGLLRWVGGSHRDPLPLYGPEGLLDVAEGFERAYQHDARYRVAHHGAAVAAARRRGIRGAAVRDARARAKRSCSGSATASASARSASSTSPCSRGGLPLRLRRPLARRERRHEEIREPARAGARRRSGRARGALAAARRHPARRGRERGQREPRQDHDRHPRLSHHAGRGRRARAGRRSAPPAALPRRAAAAVPGLEGVFLDGVSAAFSGGVTLGRDGTRISLPSGSEAVDVDQP